MTTSTARPERRRRNDSRDRPAARRLARGLEALRPRRRRVPAITSPARPDIRVVLTGAGSSAFIGEIAAPALRRHLDRRVEAIADDRHRRQPARLPRAAHPDADGVVRPVGQQPRKPRHHRAGRRTRRRHLASRPHLRPRRPTGPRAQRPRRTPASSSCRIAPTTPASP